jgi:hypothetical protein
MRSILPTLSVIAETTDGTVTEQEVQGMNGFSLFMTGVKECNHAKRVDKAITTDIYLDVIND